MGRPERNVRRLTRFAVVAVVTAVALAAAFRVDTGGSAASSSPGADLAPASLREPGSIVVRARRSDDLDRVAAYARSNGYTVTARAGDLHALRVRPPKGVSTARAVTQFRSRPGVEFVEPAWTMSSADRPADPLYTKQSPYLEAVHAPEAWDIEKGAATTLVAVVDSGIDLSHPDLQGRVWVNPNETANNGVDDDANGCIDDINGCSFIEDPSTGCSGSLNGNVRDDLGHGTFVAGVVAANANSQGMVGVARGVTVVPVKVLDCNGDGDTLAVAQGILYAARVGARVMNISLGGPVDSAIVREAVRAAHDDFGVVIVAATGNTGSSGVNYPARYPNVIAVGAASSANADQRAPFSTAGPEVDVVAVGQSIVGTVPKSSCQVFLKCLATGPYAVGAGTSFAAPQVTGLVALMLSRTPTLKPDSVLNIIRTTADPVPAGVQPDWAGAGRINMLKALKPQYRIGAAGTTRS
ncbi:MAG: S8 family serine peptidase [Chloroflexi bacterium]|nr:S8 family serine peptidase [Chloroflexota bacterium]